MLNWKRQTIKKIKYINKDEKKNNFKRDFYTFLSWALSIRH